MKLLTINTHSLIEHNYETKLRMFCDCICGIKPDIIAMQEVNQEIGTPIAAMCNGFAVREDNHALRVCEMLKEKDMEYRYFWHGIKMGFGKYCEGVAILSRLPVDETDVFQISRINEPSNWKTRMGLGVKVGDSWFYTVHTGRCDDTDELFSEQVKKITERSRGRGQVWLMGDFNCPHESEEYNKILQSGWNDTFSLADKHDSGITVPNAIDGWEENERAMRIDYVFVNNTPCVKSSRVVFNGIAEPVVSDHYGVLVTI